MQPAGVPKLHGPMVSTKNLSNLFAKEARMTLMMSKKQLHSQHFPGLSQRNCAGSCWYQEHELEPHAVGQDPGDMFFFFCFFGGGQMSSDRKPLGSSVKYCSSWWLNQPIWKNITSKWESSPNRGENKQYLKPPPRLLFLNRDVTNSAKKKTVNFVNHEILIEVHRDLKKPVDYTGLLN